MNTLSQLCPAGVKFEIDEYRRLMSEYKENIINAAENCDKLSIYCEYIPSNANRPQLIGSDLIGELEDSISKNEQQLVNIDFRLGATIDIDDILKVKYPHTEKVKLLILYDLKLRLHSLFVIF
jgi:hypothetical protein